MDQITKLAVVAQRNDDIAIGAGKILIGHDGRVLVAHPPRLSPAIQPVRSLVGEQGHLRIEQGQVDMLALPGAIAMLEGGENRDCCIETGSQVAYRNADLERMAIGIAGHAHQAAHSLDQEVVSALVLFRAGLSEASDRAIDQVRLHRLERRVVEPVFGESADAEILQHDISLRRQLADQVLPFRFGQVDCDRPLVAIGAEVIGGIA